MVASTEEISAFYDAMMRRIDQIVDYLDGYFGGDMPASAHRLFLMWFSLVGVVPMVELYQRREAVEACDPLWFNPQR